MLRLQFIAFLSLFTFASFGFGQPIIDTDFSLGNADQIPLGQKEPASAADFPLKTVTSPKETAAVEAPSTLVISNKASNGLQPPFVRATLKRKPPEAVKPNDNPFAGTGLSWKFLKAPLGPGKFQATWTLLPVSPLRELKMSFVLMGENADGTLGKIEVVVAPHEMPLIIVASENKLSAGDKSTQLKEDRPNDVIVDFDLTKNTWGAKLNGKQLFKDKPFPKDYLGQYEKFRVVALAFGGGALGNMEGAEYAFGPVKLTKLP